MKNREKLYWLGCTDSRSNNWIIEWENPLTDRVEYFPAYHKMRCRRCGKIDELTAVHSGLNPLIKIRSRRDFVVTCDLFRCVSNRMRDIIINENITGVRFLQLPDNKYSLLLPDLIAITSPAGSGMEFFNQCKICGRYRETTMWPRIVRISNQTSNKFIAFPDTRMEKHAARSFWFLITDTVHRIFKKHHATGYDSYNPLEALWSDDPR